MTTLERLQQKTNSYTSYNGLKSDSDSKTDLELGTKNSQPLYGLTNLVNGLQANQLPSAAIRNGDQVINGNLLVDGTVTGNKIRTGKIESISTDTYFDLDNNRIVINDGVTDRVIIGQFI